MFPTFKIDTINELNAPVIANLEIESEDSVDRTVSSITTEEEKRELKIKPESMVLTSKADSVAAQSIVQAMKKDLSDSVEHFL